MACKNISFLQSSEMGVFGLKWNRRETKHTLGSLLWNKESCAGRCLRAGACSLRQWSNRSAGRRTEREAWLGPAQSRIGNCSDHSGQVPAVFVSSSLTFTPKKAIIKSIWLSAGKSPSGHEKGMR
ncbi:hypothetical protein CLOSTMETH_01252 [[Clostridium] methylpentosum DSM 5476]|uniref:Uncharacterized protein n=1 Tax=[Clostridium] methylpentosum DSM 5476 TaxID=537013 RepID=C0EBN4_9FIRM|nr:hypothetical protein CLOSTMETH_01252 [[Clostridium] methylpentosum DSM 5476]